MQYTKFGTRIKALRELKNENITEAAKGLGIDRSYLSKLEKGRLKPSKNVLNLLSSYFSLKQEEAVELWTLGGYPIDASGIVTLGENFSTGVKAYSRRGVMTVEDKTNQNQSSQNKGVEITVPQNTAILYSDSAFVTTSPYGVVFDFAQTMGPTNKQTVVARVGMSQQHAEALLKVLEKRLQNRKKQEFKN